MKKYLLIVGLIGAMIFALYSCDRPTPLVSQIVQPAQTVAAQPVVVQQSNDGFWQNMMIWHLLSNSGPTVVHHYDSRAAYVAPRAPVVSNTTIINKTVVSSTTPAPTATPIQTARSTPSSTYSAPARATSYSGSYSSRPSYSSYSSRSSYSGFSGGRR